MRDAEPRRVSLQFLKLSALLCRGVGDTRRYHGTFKRAAGLRHCLHIGDHVLLRGHRAVGAPSASNFRSYSDTFAGDTSRTWKK